LTNAIVDITFAVMSLSNCHYDVINTGMLMSSFTYHMCNLKVLLTNSSLGPKFSSQGNFHSLQLLNVPQFLFSRVVRLKTAPQR